MKRKRSLIKELNITDCRDSGISPLDIDIEKIKVKVNSIIASADVERKKSIMKPKKKFIALAVAVVLAVGVTAFAANGIITSWYSSSSSIPEYTSLPTVEKCMEDIGYAPVLIDSFENGYEFKNGSVIKNDLQDENHNSVEKFKSVMFRYEKDGDTVNFSQEKFNSGVDSIGDIVLTLDGVDVYYHSYMNKLVPADYQMTEEDEKAEESGELVFSWGSDKVEVSKVQSVAWSKDGVHYLLMQIDGKLSADELTEMAKEVIER